MKNANGKMGYWNGLRKRISRNTKTRGSSPAPSEINANLNEEENVLREIKFRVWNKVNKTMYEDAINNCKDTFDMILKHPQIYEVMQYTGQKDKNEVEIYEGDVIKESKERFKNKRHFVVVWNNDIGNYTFKPLDKMETSYPCFNIGTIKNLEIIGNIYKNPELLSA